MTICCDGELVMPSSYDVMKEDEMISVEGGGVSLQMSSFYYKGYYVNMTAQGLVSSGQVKGMTQLEVAQEIFAHAAAYKFAVEYLHIKTGIVRNILQSIYDSSKVIDIEDGGDKRFGYKKAFEIIWKVLPANI